MKRTFIFAGMLLASAIVGGATASIISSNNSQKVESLQKNDTFKDVKNHFASYQKESFPDLTYAAENAVEAVVNIELYKEVRPSGFGSRGGYDPFLEFFGIPQGYSQRGGREQGDNQPKESLAGGGSGVIISSDGYIVTNNHVVEDASRVVVNLNDDRQFEATVIGTDPTTDVALIKIDAEALPFLKFGSSDDLRLGEWVVAIGSPFDLRSTITAGIVSAKARNLGAIPAEYSIESFIQTDAAINPGNSGGALVNTSGELVGINTLIKSQTGTYMGYAFAVPSSIVKKVVVDLKEYGIVQRAMLGVAYQEINEDFIKQFGEEYGIDKAGGLYVAEVRENSAAEAAGIKKGDIILEIDGVDIKSSAVMSEIIAKHRPNDTIKISVDSDGKVKQLDVVLRNKSGKAELVSKDDTDASLELGGTFAEVSDRVKRQLEIKGGLRVTSVKSDGVLARARISEGYIITAINDRPVRTLSDLESIDSKITSIDGVYPNGRAISYSIVQ